LAEKEVWIEKSENERVRVAINEFSGKNLLDIRSYYQAEDGEWRPTKKGVSLSVDKLEELQNSLSKLQ